MIIPATYAQVHLKFLGNGAPNGAEVVFGVSNAAALTPTVIANRVITNFTANVAALLTTDVTLASVLVKLGPNATGAFSEVASGQTGAAAPPTMTPQNALLVRKITSVGGKGGRGRSFWVGITEGTANASGLIAGGTVAVYQAGFTAFLAQLTTDLIPMVLLHDGSAAPVLVDAYVVDGRMATQRRRLRR